MMVRRKRRKASLKVREIIISPDSECPGPSRNVDFRQVVDHLIYLHARTQRDVNPSIIILWEAGYADTP